MLQVHIVDFFYLRVFSPFLVFFAFGSLEECGQHQRWFALGQRMTQVKQL